MFRVSVLGGKKGKTTLRSTSRILFSLNFCVIVLISMCGLVDFWRSQICWKNTPQIVLSFGSGISFAIMKYHVPLLPPHFLIGVRVFFTTVLSAFWTTIVLTFWTTVVFAIHCYLCAAVCCFCVFGRFVAVCFAGSFLDGIFGRFRCLWAKWRQWRRWGKGKLEDG